MKLHILQSNIWKQFQKEIKRKIVEGSGDGWSYVGIVEHDRFGEYIYVPYGPYAVNEKALRLATKDLKEKALELCVYVINVEPTPPITYEIASRVFKHKGMHRQAHRTLVIDLSKDEDEIIANMSKSRRKQYRNYDKKGISIEKSNSIETLDKFFDLLQISSKEKGFYVRDKTFFDKMFDTLVADGHASLFVAKRDNEVEVVALVYDDDETRYYAHVGRDLTDSSLQASAPLIAYMIIDAKRSGKKFFDLYGISESDDKIDEKSGFTVFKKTFGGEVVNFAGAWEIPISKPKYYIKNILRFIKSILKRT